MAARSKNRQRTRHRGRELPHAREARGAAANGFFEAAECGGVVLQGVLHMAHAEVHVARFVGTGAAHDVRGDFIGRVILDIAKQVEKRSLAEHAQQERGLREIFQHQQRVQAGARGGMADADAAAAFACAFQEDVDVAGFVPEFRLQALPGFDLVRVQAFA